MNNIIDVTPGDSSVGVVNEDETQLDLFFKMHERVNAKNEEISKTYSNNILVTIKDVEELHYKTIQSINSLQPAMSQINTRIAVSHNEGESEKFNSFDEFLNHNKTSPNPTSNIMMTYTFTLHDLEKDTFENYKVNNVIRSRIAELSQIEKEAPSFLSSAIISSLVTTSAMITIEYSDYVKARHFTAMFDEWIKGCEESKSSKVIVYLKKITKYIQPVGIMTIYALMAYFTASAIDEKFIDSNLIVKFVVIYASFFLVVRGVSDMLLRSIESSIDSYLAISYLNISKGDAKLIKKFTTRNKSSLMWAVGGLLGTIVIGIFTSMTYDFIKWFIQN